MVFLSPRPGVDVVKWSVGDGNTHPTQLPPGAQQPQYFIYYSYGLTPDKPWSFWIDVQVKKNSGLLGHFFKKIVAR